MELDSLDLRIIEELSKNARVKLSELSRKLAVPRTTISSRIEKMVKMGVIKSFTTMLDYSTLGYKFLAFVMIKVRRGTGKLTDQVSITKKIVEDINRSNSKLRIIESHIVTGEYDVLLKVIAKDWSELTKFLIEYLTKLSEIEHTNTMLVLTTVHEGMVL
ncbi:MAG: hypothetical protein DRJ49_03435 [Thermoprotei archaeon]|nr:MAG: hypothetical protein DRN53_05425 [Thermoprotei archaeon]RLE89300.1 MAG: hypothetical protein DRJ49_03435 [Thermoprotei archaeon]